MEQEVSGIDANNSDYTYSRDFDYCTENWNELASESRVRWTSLDRGSFQNKLFLALQEIVKYNAELLEANLASAISEALNDANFHPITMVHVINTLPMRLKATKDQLSALGTALANYWMKSYYFVWIVLGLTKKPTGDALQFNTKQFYDTVFSTGEKYANEEVFIRYLLSKLDTALRVVIQQEKDGVECNSNPYAITNLLNRLFVRFDTVQLRNFSGQDGNPFIAFVKSLIGLSQSDSKIPQILTVFCSGMNKPALEKFLWYCFEIYNDESDCSEYPLFPLREYLEGPHFRSTILHTIPFTSTRSYSNHFWINWAKCITSDDNFTQSIWDEFQTSFWGLVSIVDDGDRLKTPAHAFAAFATCIKGIMHELKLVLPLLQIFEHIRNLIESVSMIKIQIAWALTHIVVDLERRQEEVEQDIYIGRTFAFECYEPLYVSLLSVYEQRSIELIVEQLQIATTASKLANAAREKESDGQEYDEVLDESVRRLRALRLIPNSMLEVYHVFKGDREAKTESDTRALKQLAILKIPILLCGGASVINTHAEDIARSLFKWEDDKGLNVFSIIALFELANVNPIVVSKVFAELIFGVDLTIGDKIRILHKAERIMIYISTNHCVCCLPLHDTYNKEKMVKFIRQMHPAYLPKYLERNKEQRLCPTCPPLVAVESPTRAKWPPINENTAAAKKQVLKTQPSVPSESNELSGREPLVTSRPPPKTRRWGVKQKEIFPPIPAKKDSFHTCIWAEFYYRLLRDDLNIFHEKYNCGAGLHFCMQLFIVLKLNLKTYSGLSCFVSHIPRQVFELVDLYRKHPTTHIRMGLWLLMVEIFQNQIILENICETDGITDPMFFRRCLSDELDYKIIQVINNICQSYKYKNLGPLDTSDTES